MEGNGQATMILPEDTSNLCRVCLVSNQNNLCIFRNKINQPASTDLSDSYDLPEILRICGGVEIAENDGLPTSICAKCMMKLNDAHELRKQCQRADAKLRELFCDLGRKCNVETTLPLANIPEQYCQMKVDTGESSKADDKPLSETMDAYLEDDSISEQKLFITPSYEEQEHPPDQSSSDESINMKQKQTGKEAYRTRRMTRFKRVTSMENLKNHKERQRQYIKKNANIKRETVDANSTGKLDSRGNSNGVKGTSDSDGTYACSMCTRCYSSQKSLNRHVQTHGKQQSNKQLSQVKKLEQRQRKNKSNLLRQTKEKPKSVLCKICNKNFRKTDTMVRHLNVHKRVNPKEVLSILKEIRDKRKVENIGETQNGALEVEDESRLNVCSELESPTAADFESNVECTSDSSAYQCTYCPKRYVSEKSLKRHLLIHDGKKFVCKVCNMTFFRQDRLKSHKSRYGHDEDAVPLETEKPSDDKSAIKLINSWIREELDSDNEGKGFPCDICGKSYDTKKSLSKHQINSHCGNRDEECKNARKRRKEEEKDGEGSKPFSCDECSKTFEKEVKLQRHLRIHERAKEQQDANFKRFLCHICSKTFRQNTGLMFHMRTHTGYKPHVCKYCGRGFTSNSNCINHERTHTGDRPFVCHFCSAAFAKSCTLKAHITTHTGEANYHCKTCGKSFRRLKYLKEHRFTHTGEKPYACKICGTAYSHSGSLFVHEKKCKAQHGDNYQPPNTSSQSVRNTQTYCQTTLCPITAPPTPILLAVLPQAQAGKVYNAVDNVQRMNPSAVSTPNLHAHSNSDISDVSTAVRGFAIIGQIFQS